MEPSEYWISLEKIKVKGQVSKGEKAINFPSQPRIINQVIVADGQFMRISAIIMFAKIKYCKITWEAILKIFQIVQHFPPLLQHSGGKHCYWVDTKQPLKREQQMVRFFFRLFLCWCWWELTKIVMAQRNCQIFKFIQKLIIFPGGKEKIQF